MTAFKTIKGVPVKTISGDRAGASFEGQLYYDSDGVGIFKFVGALGAVSTGSWASGGNLGTARQQATAAGTQDAAIAVGGGTANVEQYNGSSWTEVANLNVLKTRSGMSTNSPNATTINFGGVSPSASITATAESWDNSSWTEVGDLNAAILGSAGFGVSNASAGSAGGQNPAGNMSVNNELWDGSSWTEVNNLNSARRYLGGLGTVTAALVVGGDTDNDSFPGGRYTAFVESYNGTSWTEIANLNAGRAYVGTAGIQTDAIVFGGSPPGYLVSTEAWNGTAWTEVNNLATGRRAWSSGTGTSLAALSAGGETGPGSIATTEEWTVTNAVKTIDLS